MTIRKDTELQQLVERLRVAHFHLSNMITIAARNAEDEQETALDAARSYINGADEVCKRVRAIADEQAREAANV